MTEHPQTKIMKLEHELTKVRQQHDELLAACQAFLSWYNTDAGSRELRDAVELGERAIAKAKGGLA